MASYSDESTGSESKSAAELQREAEQQRMRVEDTIGQLQEKLSPGQLIDEVLSYTKSGSGDFLTSLGRSAAANPLPVALMGVSLYWLIAKPGSSATSGSADYSSDYSNGGERSSSWWPFGGRKSRSSGRSSSYTRGDYGSGSDYGSSDGYQGGASAWDTEDDDDSYGYAVAEGSLRRTGRSSDETGHYAEFMDDAGSRYRAKTDEHGNRVGHFLNDAGAKFRGFTDAAGSRITKFMDEAGELLSDASGWASDRLSGGRRAMGSVKDSLASHASSAGSAAYRAGSAAGSAAKRVGSTAQQHGGKMMKSGMQLFQDQPLVGAALAFVAGAAIGATLPVTEQENKVMGKAADKLKSEVADKAEQAYEAGKEQAATLYEQATETAGDVLNRTKEAVGEQLAEVIPSGDGGKDQFGQSGTSASGMSGSGMSGSGRSGSGSSGSGTSSRKI